MENIIRKVLIAGLISCALVHEQHAAMPTANLASIDEHSFVFLTPNASHAIAAPIRPGDACNPNSVAITPTQHGTLPVQTLHENVTVPVLSLAGGHMDFGRLGTTGSMVELGEYWNTTLRPLYENGFRAKVIILDACIGLNLIPAFVPLLADNGIIIALAINGSMQCFTEAIKDINTNHENLIGQLMNCLQQRSSLMHHDGGLLTDEEAMSMAVMYNETFMPSRDANPLFIQFFNQEMSDCLPGVNIDAWNKDFWNALAQTRRGNMPCSFVIYDHKTQSILFDENLEDADGFAGLFTLGSDETICQSFGNCKQCVEGFFLPTPIDLFKTEAFHINPHDQSSQLAVRRIPHINPINKLPLKRTPITNIMSIKNAVIAAQFNTRLAGISWWKRMIYSYVLAPLQRRILPQFTFTPCRQDRFFESARALLNTALLPN